MTSQIGMLTCIPVCVKGANINWFIFKRNESVVMNELRVSYIVALSGNAKQRRKLRRMNRFKEVTSNPLPGQFSRDGVTVRLHENDEGRDVVVTYHYKGLNSWK